MLSCPALACTGKQRQRFNAIQQELAELSTQFSSCPRCDQGLWLDPHDPGGCRGPPASLLSLAAQAAREAGASGATPEHGPWRITLDFPIAPFLNTASGVICVKRSTAPFISRASTGPEDNTPLINRILQLRQEQAVLLGYHTYAELSLASKMAPDVTAVERLLEELRQAFAAAAQDLDDLKIFASTQGL